VKSLPFLINNPKLLFYSEEKNELLRCLFNGKRNGTPKPLLLIVFD